MKINDYEKKNKQLVENTIKIISEIYEIESSEKFGINIFEIKNRENDARVNMLFLDAIDLVEIFKSAQLGHLKFFKEDEKIK